MTKPLIAVTSGDPAGVGPELIQRALDDPQIRDLAEYHCLGEFENLTPGQPSPASARSALRALEDAVALAREGKVQGIVTGPVSKAALAEVGFEFPGQTEFLAHQLEVDEVCMIMAGARLTAGLVSTHLSLRKAVAQLDEEKIVRAGRLLAEFCRLRNGRSRLAVAGLNPHAGEQGMFGDEETLIIAPSVARLNTMGIGEFSGPYSPDAVFRHAFQGECDAVLAMYHDQALIPFKLMEFETGVNVSMGLPVIRTSPDHGTAFPLAGTGRADSGSMKQAFLLAATLAGKLNDSRAGKAPGL